MGIPLCVICCFSLAAFNICSLCLIFVNLINMCLGGVSPWVYPVWDSLGFLDVGDYFLPHFREVFNYYFLKYFLMVYLFVFFFRDSYDSNVGTFNIVHRSLMLFSFLFILFSFFLSVSFISIILSSTSLILSSASIILLLVPSRGFLISFVALLLALFYFF